MRKDRAVSTSTDAHPATPDGDAGASLPPLDALPPGWSAGAPDGADTADLHDLLRRHEVAARGSSSAGLADVEADVTGPGRHTRRHVLVSDARGRARGWATVHDRAAGRVLVSAVVDPHLPDDVADALAATLLGWAERASSALGRERGLDLTQMDSGAFAADERQQRFLRAAGFEHTRTWWQMGRPVTEEDADGVAQMHPDLTVRRVRRAGGGMPDEADLVAVHDVLEEAFADHFNYHEETFDEFLSRLREDPGHRWDHWWLAELTQDGGTRPAGALVGTVSPGAGEAPASTYVAYLGVLRSARGRGVAKSLLRTVIADAAARGRARVSLEVDADSPTGANELYAAEGFVTSYSTQSWHKDVVVSS